ncbi:heat shock protein 70 family [Phycomyces nitens]|nr:heat shock protein 70 family [Phycomyces nitens]
MSVVGFDLGNLQSVIAVARNRGIDVICNEVSNRATPSLVSFGFKQRFLGESAKTQEIGNFKNTVGSLKRLAGRRLDDPEIVGNEVNYITAQLAEVDGQVGAAVNFLGESRSFSNIQLLAMFLGKLKETASHELKIPVSDCVITVPGWFTEVQRRAVLDAAEVVGLNCLRLVNDLAAAALGYGITKPDLPEEKPRNVAFVDIGYSSYSTYIVSFIKGQLTVRGAAYDIHFGGRVFDHVIVEKLGEEFKEKYKIDVFSNKKALLRLRGAAERCKKMLSANPQAPVNIESIMDDKDVSAIVNRADFEEWAAHLFTRTELTLSKALEHSGLSVEDIDAVEIVGGSTRIPAIKTTISKFFNKEISTTLNQDEAISRGAALQCAMLSPAFKVRDFRVQEIITYPIKLQWAQTPEDEDTEILAFDRNNSLPSTKILTFNRSKPFLLEAYYAYPEELPTGISAWIGQYNIKDVEPLNGKPAEVKVKVKINIHGVLSVVSAHTVEEKEVEEEVKNKDGEKEIKKVKKTVKGRDLGVVSIGSALPRDVMNRYIEQESQMSANDKLIIATEAAKNALEEYGYDMRDKIMGPLSDFIDPAIKDRFASDLNAVVDWIYDEGDDAHKSVYVEKLETLKKIGGPVVERFRESEELARAERQLHAVCARLTEEAMSTVYSHIPAQDKQDIVERCERARRWLVSELAKHKGLPKHMDKPLTSKEILKEEEELRSFATSLLNKPKPAPEPEPEAKKEGEDKEDKEDTPMEDTEEPKENDMDVD